MTGMHLHIINTNKQGLHLNVINPLDNNKPVTKQDREAQWNKVKDNYSWHAGFDYRLHPELYFIGKGEQGVLICEPAIILNNCKKSGNFGRSRHLI